MQRQETAAGPLRRRRRQPDTAASFADRIVGWRTKADPAGRNGEVDVYKRAGLDYPPRQAPFQNALELPLVFGIPPDIVERILPFVTVSMDIAKSTSALHRREVLSALPNVTPDQLQKVLAGRLQRPIDGEGC